MTTKRGGFVGYLNRYIKEASLPQGKTWVGDANGVATPTTLNAAAKLTVRVPGTWAIDGDGNGGGLCGLVSGDLTNTEAAAAMALNYDLSITDYQLISTSSGGANVAANYQPYVDADSEGVGDYCAFGAAKPFAQLYFDVDTAAVWNDDGALWEYWNGSSWSTLSGVYDTTDSTAQDGLRPFQVDGTVTFVPPSDWATTELNSTSAYWIRSRVTATEITTTPTLNSLEHHVVTPTDGIRVPFDCVVTDIRLTDEAGTLHTTNDIKFFLMNFTKATNTAALTFAQDQAADSWTGLTLDCDAGDILYPVVVQEDGTNEAGPCTLELDVTIG